MRHSFITLLFASVIGLPANPASPPNIVLFMTDDQGWGQAGYYGHPALKTPNLDAMAANGLRLDRFYAGAPNCSPTRATVLTGRSNDRTGVENHGFALRLQEKVLPRALRDAGYATGHFGKWHLNGFQGPGVPILAADDHHPGHFGFDEWVSVSNFFDRDPIMSRMGKFEEFKGNSSEIIVEEALEFIRGQFSSNKPFFAVIWDGSPHSPWDASEEDRKPFMNLNENSAHHYGELAAMDRALGTLRAGLRKLGAADNTILWFNSDNGGLPRIEPDTVGGLRGFKGSVYEGGLRVPAVVEWPAKIKPGRVSSYPCATMDIFPTIAEIAGLPDSSMLQPQDGSSLLSLFERDMDRRSKPIPFRHTGRAALIDNDHKLVVSDVGKREYQLFNLARDNKERTDLFDDEPAAARRMVETFEAWNESVNRSYAGLDYPEGRVSPGEPKRRPWMTAPEYKPYIDQLRQRPEYRDRLNAARRQSRPRPVFSVRGDELLLDGKPFKIIGLRCSNALMTGEAADDLIEHLPFYKSRGVNTVSVFFMGSRFGDVKGYRPDASLDPVHAARMGRIIEAAGEHGMIVLVGCLYWSNSKAKEDLTGRWKQEHANRAVANTVRWLSQNDYRNVFVDPDNEGMAHDATGWSIAAMIDAGHAVDSSIMIAYNDGDAPPDNADLYIHHSPKVEGKPWLDSEATPRSAPGGYWGSFSKETHQKTDGEYYNYSRVGRYTEEMKAEQLRRTEREIERYNGHMLASTWIQCAPHEGVGGPFAHPGGHSRIEDVNEDIDKVHPDAGIAWWLEFVKEKYGPWRLE